MKNSEKLSFSVAHFRNRPKSCITAGYLSNICSTFYNFSTLQLPQFGPLHSATQRQNGPLQWGLRNFQELVFEEKLGSPYVFWSGKISRQRWANF